jgi:hypothetical protein
MRRCSELEMTWRAAEKRTSLDRVGLDKGKNEFEMDR